MTIEKAMQRIVWRVSNGNYTPNQNDVEAVTALSEWINRQKTEEIQKNRIFAKMYVYCFINELQFYQDIKFAQKKLHEILKTPVVELYENFKNKYNAVELNNFKKSLGFSNLHPLATSKEQSQKEADLIKENHEVIQKYVLGIWTTEKIQNGLNNQISEAINNYKNLN
jgi:hypothetical protein